MRYLLVAGLLVMVSQPVQAQSASWENDGSGSSPWLESITVEGGPIATNHFQSGNEDYRERHGLAIVKASTRSYGNWGLYVLAPNSVDRTSVGVGYVTDPYVIPVSGPVRLELSGAVGLVTGYQDYPVPLLAGEARLVVYQRGPWDAGLSMAALPYYAQDRNGGDDNFGIVATIPFLSVRYSFDTYR